MQFPPDAPTLLDAIAALLDDEVIGAVPADLQHRVRVAANLSRLVARESRLGELNARRQRRTMLAYLDGDVTLTDHELAAELARRLRHEDDPARLDDAWRMLVLIARDDLAVAKPGHDGWEGE